jgi:predicted acyl esterase
MNAPKQKKILKNLKAVFWQAINNNKWYTALQVAALQGKCAGLFDKRRFPDIKRISEMSERELYDFMAVLKKHDPELEKKEREKEMGYPEKPPLIPKHPPPCVCPECFSYE